MEKLKEASIIISTGVTELSKEGVDEVTMDGIQMLYCCTVVLVVGLVDVGGAQTGCVGGGPYWGEVRVVLGVVVELVVVVIGLVVGEGGFVVVVLVDMVVDVIVVEVVDVDVAGVVDVVFLDGVTVVVVVVVTVVELTVGVNRVVVVVAVAAPCDVVADVEYGV